jgi:hypothetical protein
MVSRRSPLPDNEIWEIGSKKRMKQIKAGGDDRKITDCFHRFPI